MLLEAKEFETLFEYDQLKRQQRERKVLIGFNEGDIKHMPTYKYNPGSDVWDSSEKNRPPAWCDRILWHGGPTSQKAYRSHQKLMLSDHKPVSALFEALVKVKNEEKYRKCYKEVMTK